MNEVSTAARPTRCLKLFRSARCNDKPWFENSSYGLPLLADEIPLSLYGATRYNRAAAGGCFNEQREPFCGEKNGSFRAFRNDRQHTPSRASEEYNQNIVVGIFSCSPFTLEPKITTSETILSNDLFKCCFISVANCLYPIILHIYLFKDMLFESLYKLTVYYFFYQ